MNRIEFFPYAKDLLCTKSLSCYFDLLDPECFSEVKIYSRIQKPIIPKIKMLTLQSSASLQLLSSICTHKGVLVLLRKCPPFQNLSETLCVKQTKQYKRLERRVAKILSNIPLPRLLRKQVMSQLLHASQEVLKWIHCHTDNPTLKIKVPRHFVWNSNGSISYKKTAELIVQDESRTIPQRFKTACLYCQEKEIRELWIKMKSSQQKIFYNPKSPERIKQNHIISYWSYQIQTVPMRWKSKKMFTLAAFDYAVSEGHLEATRFFFELLQGRRRSLLEVYVRKLASRRNYEVYYKFLSTNGVCNLLFYLHNRMDPVDQEDIKQRYPFAFLMSCLIEVDETHIKAMIDSDRRSTAREIAEKLNASHTAWLCQETQFMETKCLLTTRQIEICSARKAARIGKL
ncbi:uncharacterized protein CDAR_58351 [Caerostris darwini]|uniref:Uncharacterized protein n=1 Tax=Caerostris darwini TaxID=1538125 RepID=A0AAV4U768_9ARAC|nr:uncharacterized protein CDAR_58351 [Caerostris darwini]